MTLLLIRFPSLAAEKLAEKANDQFERDSIDGRTPARYGISIYGDHMQPGESVDDTIMRICANAPVNGRNVAVFEPSDLDAIGLAVHDDIPPPMHYLIGNDDLSTLPEVNRLAVLLEAKKRRNPAWTRTRR